jgi:hypothetical protein
VGVTFQYALTADSVKDLAGSGNNVCEPGYDTVIFAGTIVATDTAALVFNHLLSYAGQAVFDSASIKNIIANTAPASLWL